MSLRILQHITEWFPFVFRLLSDCIQNTENGARIYRTLSARFPNKCTNSSSSIYRMFADFTGILEWFWKRSERVHHVLCLFGVFGKQTLHSGSVRAIRKMFWKNTGRVLAIRYTFGGINEKEILKGYWKRSESIRHVLWPFRVFGKHKGSFRMH